jgi:hypothetical protein
MHSTTRCTLAAAIGLAVFAAGAAVGAHSFGQPDTVLHIVTVKWKADATDEQKQQAIDGVRTLASKYDGIKNVWLKPLKVQGMDSVMVMEFRDAAALKAYADSPAQKKWYEVYLPIRSRSRTHDVTN